MTDTREEATPLLRRISGFTGVVDVDHQAEELEEALFVQLVSIKCGM